MATPIVTPSKIKQIELVVDDNYNLLKLKTLGPAFLTPTELKRLVERGFINEKHEIKDTILTGYLKAYLAMATAMPTKLSVRERSMKMFAVGIDKFVEQLKEKAKTDIVTIINNAELRLRNQLLDPTIRGTIEEGIKRSQAARTISLAVREKSGQLYNDWDRFVISELGRAFNLGSLDAIIDNNPDKSHDEIYCYFSGPNDQRTCKYCLKFYFMPDGSTPRIYKLSELIANGSNYGKKAADWLPGCEPCHPRCRHVLVELSDGYGFEDGGLKYQGKFHNEFFSQKKK